jgi:hypothetical protein
MIRDSATRRIRMTGKQISGNEALGIALSILSTVDYEAHQMRMNQFFSMQSAGILQPVSAGESWHAYSKV